MIIFVIKKNLSQTKIGKFEKFKNFLSIKISNKLKIFYDVTSHLKLLKKKNFFFVIFWYFSLTSNKKRREKKIYYVNLNANIELIFKNS